jgi:hypothetical protein
MSDETTGAPQEGEATTETRPPVPESNSEGYWRRQAEKAQREADALRKAQMTEAERIKLERDEAIARATAAEERANSTVLQSRFEAEAARAGCIDADAAFNLADKSLMQMQDGKPVGIGKALKALAEQRPYLFQQQPQRRSSGGNPPGGASTGTVHQRFNDWLRG